MLDCCHQCRAAAPSLTRTARRLRLAWTSRRSLVTRGLLRKLRRNEDFCRFSRGLHTQNIMVR